MCYSNTLLRTACFLAAGAVLIGFFASFGPAESPPKTASERALYHADPEHLWNRLHEALFVRVDPDGVVRAGSFGAAVVERI